MVQASKTRKPRPKTKKPLPAATSLKNPSRAFLEALQVVAAMGKGK